MTVDNHWITLLSLTILCVDDYYLYFCYLYCICVKIAVILDNHGMTLMIIFNAVTKDYLETSKFSQGTPPGVPTPFKPTQKCNCVYKHNLVLRPNFIV